MGCLNFEKNWEVLCSKHKLREKTGEAVAYGKYKIHHKQNWSEWMNSCGREPLTLPLTNLTEIKREKNS